MGGRKPPGGDCRLRDHTAPARAHQPTNATGPRKHGSQAAASGVTLAPAANVRTARRNGQTTGTHGEMARPPGLYSQWEVMFVMMRRQEIHGRGSSASPAATTSLPASKRSGPRCHPRAAPDHHVCRLVPGGEHREALTTGLSVLREALVDKPIGCRPMCTTHEANYPIVIAVAVGRGLARFWCDHRKCWHQHGRVTGPSTTVPALMMTNSSSMQSQSSAGPSTVVTPCQSRPVKASSRYRAPHRRGTCVDRRDLAGIRIQPVIPRRRQSAGGSRAGMAQGQGREAGEGRRTMNAEQLARYMPAVAELRSAAPNRAKSSDAEWRYGRHGSLSIDLEAGTFLTRAWPRWRRPRPDRPRATLQPRPGNGSARRARRRCRRGTYRRETRRRRSPKAQARRAAVPGRAVRAKGLPAAAP